MVSNLSKKKSIYGTTNKSAMGQNYGIVVDAGSSGSRLQVFRWNDLSSTNSGSLDELLKSVPQIEQKKEWGMRINPGLSAYANKPGRIWKKHLKPLIEFAAKIVPKERQRETPIFIQATAGMRLLPELKRNKILREVCSSLRKHSDFELDSCSDHVQIIDGETEGIYGWIALNYLKRKFDNFDSEKGIDSGSTFGFMDMGGASTQIAFVPSDKEERRKHIDELYTVRLRNVDGTDQEWPIFVSTWLGFGANEAHRRHLRNLVMALPEGVNYDKDGDSTYDISDPCSQKGLTIRQQFKGVTYDIRGSGDYKQCLRTIYPLLLKHLPCKESSCLFNGVSAPKIDFAKDKFVGISEYWYTANDVFHMAGEYNFREFEQSLQGFCESDWDLVEKNFEDGEYGPNMRLPLLKDSCFKASWIVNVLHEGFGLPRIGLEENSDQDYSSKGDSNLLSSSSSASASSFQSANSVDGADLSWTLGKILLYASSRVPTQSYAPQVGVYPSLTKIEELKLQKASDEALQRDRESLFGVGPWWVLFVFITSCIAVYLFIGNRLKSRNLLLNYLRRARNITMKMKMRLVGKYHHLAGFSDNELGIQNGQLHDLEEGRFSSLPQSSFNAGGSTLRTRSTANLQELNNADLPSATQVSMNKTLHSSRLPHSQSFSNFPLRTGTIGNDLMGKRLPRFTNTINK